jgi:polyisoprenoid-binding protein YceI
LHPMADTIGTTAPNVTVRYVIDSASSRFTVQAFAGGLLSSFGHNPIIAIPDFSGEVRLAEDITQSSFTMTVRADSLRVASDISDKDRIELERIMKEKVLQIDEYLEIVYNCSKISASATGEGQYWAALNGELTLHDVTRALTIPARVIVNGEMLRASGTFSLLQSDYGIEPVSVAGGTLKVKDEVKFTFEIVGKRQG